MTSGDDMMEMQTDQDLDQHFPMIEDIEVDIETKDPIPRDIEDENMGGDGFDFEEHFMQETDGVAHVNDEEMTDEEQKGLAGDDEMLGDADEYRDENITDDFLIDEELEDALEDSNRNISTTDAIDGYEDTFTKQAEFGADTTATSSGLEHASEQIEVSQTERIGRVDHTEVPPLGTGDSKQTERFSPNGLVLVPEAESNGQHNSVEQPTLAATNDSLPAYKGTEGSDTKKETPAEGGLGSFKFEEDELLVSDDDDPEGSLDFEGKSGSIAITKPASQGQQASDIGANNVTDNLPNTHEHESAEGGNEGNLSQSETFSRDDQEDSESFRGHIHSVIVHYQDNEISLFPPLQEDESSETYFLSDEALARDSIRNILQACRIVLADSIGEHEELEIKIPCLKLNLKETTVEADSMTLAQLIDIYLQLHHNDGTEQPGPLHVVLRSWPSFHSQVDYLYSTLHAGKGFNHIKTSDTNILDTKSFEDTGLEQNNQNSGSPSQDATNADIPTIEHPIAEDSSGYQTPDNPHHGEDDDYELDFRSPATIQRSSAASTARDQAGIPAQRAHGENFLSQVQAVDNTGTFQNEEDDNRILDNTAIVEGVADAHIDIGGNPEAQDTELYSRPVGQHKSPEPPKSSGSVSSSTLRDEASEDAIAQANRSESNTNPHSADHAINRAIQNDTDDLEQDEIGYDEDDLNLNANLEQGESLKDFDPQTPDAYDHYEDNFHLFATDQHPTEQKSSSKASGPPTTSIFDEDNEDEIDYEDEEENPTDALEKPQGLHSQDPKPLSPSSLKRQRSFEEEDADYLSESSQLDPKRVRSS